VTTKEEKQIIADKVVEYSDASKRLTALEAQARNISTTLQSVEMPLRAALSISTSRQQELLASLNEFPAKEQILKILTEIKDKQRIQAECEQTLKDYGMKLPPIF
jgi:hypothetical protein